MQRIRIAFAAAALALSQQVPAFTIQLDYTYDTNNFFADLGRQAVLSSAASYFEGIIGDSLDAISPGGGNTWTASFTHPGTSNVEQIVDLEVPADTLIIYAGGRNLGGSTLGIGGFGGFSSSGDTAWNTTVSTRGEGGVPATDVGFWGGSVTFYNGGSNWYFDTDTATDEAFGTMDDFYSGPCTKLVTRWVSALQTRGRTGLREWILPGRHPSGSMAEMYRSIRA